MASSEEGEEKKPTMRRKASIASKVSRTLIDVKNKLKDKKAFLLMDFVEEEEEEPPRRYLPESLDVLCQETGLSRSRMRTLYRAFKTTCPNGAITEQIFREIYCQIFPMGDGNAYAHYIFKALDKQKNGDMTFSELVRGFSKLIRGTLNERLHWIFRLYDIDHDGEISREEMSAVIGAIHDLMGPSDQQSEQHTDIMFKKFDLNGDGVITMDEFMAYCLNDQRMCKSFSTFDNYWL